MDVLEQPRRGLVWTVQHLFLNLMIYLRCLAVQPSTPIQAASNLGKSCNCMGEERKPRVHIFCIFCVTPA